MLKCIKPTTTRSYSNRMFLSPNKKVSLQLTKPIYVWWKNVQRSLYVHANSFYNPGD